MKAFWRFTYFWGQSFPQRQFGHWLRSSADSQLRHRDEKNCQSTAVTEYCQSSEKLSCTWTTADIPQNRTDYNAVL